MSHTGSFAEIVEGSNDDFIVDGPKGIQDDWPSLKEAGFQTVDAALPNPANSDEAYFFSGDTYVLVGVKPGQLAQLYLRCTPADIPQARLTITSLTVRNSYVQSGLHCTKPSFGEGCCCNV